MLLAPHPALNQVLGIMLGIALALGDMASAWQERHLPSVRATTPAKVVPAGSGPDARAARRAD
ncbi:ankyrin repeat domain-containing protein, partial [Ralstonia pseudosolanacearum]